MSHNNLKYDVAIVGGGIIGLATAYKLQLKHPNLSLIVLEKENEVAFHQTGRNSGVIHSGLYYKPGSYRAKNCVDGRKQLVKFAKKHKITHDICGKIVLATNDKETLKLKSLKKNGKKNGLKGLKLLYSKEIKTIEPFAEGKSALFVPESGIIDYKGVTKKLSELITTINPKSCVSTNSEVIHIEKEKLILQDSVIHTKHSIFCGGLFADRLECGPNAVFTFKREGYTKTSFSWRDTWESLTFLGTLRLFFKHWRFGLTEYKRAFSKRLFLRELQKMVPSLEMDDLVVGKCGVRATVLDIDGTIVEDFKIVKHNNNIHILNAPSPAATACLSIGDEVVNFINKNFNLDNKNNGKK